ncbi:MAG TPA: BON domain-containing protein [Candidatus Sulfotelmatobacter sp.]|nr:BON domain-containing protein [Candidatus Sulfotelmatobacter sp.]
MSALALLLIALTNRIPAQVAEDQPTNQQSGIWVVEPAGQDYTPERAQADQARARRIKARLEADPWVLSYKMVVAVYQGAATLSGKVDNLLAKERAAELARTIAGIRAVHNQVLVVQPPRSDLEVRNEVVACFDNALALRSGEKSVQVEDGFVLLTGTVDSAYRQQLAERIAQSVPGVRGVENKLRVNHLAPRSDPEIQADVTSRLQWDPWLENSQVSVQVVNGTAQLSGMAASQRAKDHALQDAQVTGVKATEANNLKILDQTTSAVLKGGRS